MSNKLNIICIKNVLGVNDWEDITKEKDLIRKKMINIIDKTDFVDNEKSNYIEIFKISQIGYRKI